MVEAVAAAAVAATGTTHPPSSPATNGGYEKTWSSAFGTLRIPAAACMTNAPPFSPLCLWPNQGMSTQLDLDPRLSSLPAPVWVRIHHQAVVA